MTTQQATLPLWGETKLEPAAKAGSYRVQHYAGHRSLSRVKVVRGALHGYDVTGELCRVDRTVHYNPDGSQHRCNAACKHARGKECECSCGGRFHGIHRFSAGANLSLL